MLHLAQIQPQLQSVREMLETTDKQYAPPGHLPFSAIRAASFTPRNKDEPEPTTPARYLRSCRVPDRSPTDFTNVGSQL